MRTRRRVLLSCAAAAPAAVVATASAFRLEPMQVSDAAAYDAACPAPAAHAAFREEMVGVLADLPPTERGLAVLRSSAVCSYCLCDVMLDLPPDLLPG